MEQMTAEQPCGAQGLGVLLRWSFTFPQSGPGSPSGSPVAPDFCGSLRVSPS